MHPCVAPPAHHAAVRAPAWDWKDVYTRMSDADAERGYVKPRPVPSNSDDPTLLRSANKGVRWHALNMLCELDQAVRLCCSLECVQPLHCERTTFCLSPTFHT